MPDEEPTPSIAEAALDAEDMGLPPPSLARDGPAVAGMGVLFLASIGLALAFSFTFLSQNVRAFQDPESLANPIIYLVIVVIFTLVILAIAKWGKRIIIKYVILASVLMTVYYVAAPLLSTVMSGGLSELGPASILGGVIAVGVTALLWFYPEWYVIDVAGILVAAGAAGIFGISFGIIPCLVLLIAFAVYDAIAVYRTKHMLDLADSVLELRLPIMFVVPKHRGYSFLEETRKIKNPGPDDKPEKREAMFMGLGDLVMPTILVVSALQFGHAGWGILPSLGAAIGTLAGFGVLMGYVLKGRPQAGLPLLNGGALVGFLAGVYWATGSLVFW